MGQQDQETRALSRQRPLQQRTLSQEPWVALDRDGSGRDPSLDTAEMRFAVLVRTRHDSMRVSERLGKRHKTIGMWAHQMMRLVRRWLPDRSIKLMGDTAYSVLELGLHANHQQVILITTGRLDAVLHEPPPERTQHTIGRPRVVGTRLPALEQVLQDPETVWQTLTLDCYSEGEPTVEICTGTALCYGYGSDPLPIRWVLTRDPSGKRHPKAIFSTDPTQTAEQIVNDAHEALESGSDL